jgi:hypothetical protein
MQFMHSRWLMIYILEPCIWVYFKHLTTYNGMIRSEIESENIQISVLLVSHCMHYLIPSCRLSIRS